MILTGVAVVSCVDGSGVDCWGYGEMHGEAMTDETGDATTDEELDADGEAADEHAVRIVVCCCDWWCGCGAGDSIVAVAVIVKIIIFE